MGLKKENSGYPRLCNVHLWLIQVHFQITLYFFTSNANTLWEFSPFLPSVPFNIAANHFSCPWGIIIERIFTIIFLNKLFARTKKKIFLIYLHFCNTLPFLCRFQFLTHIIFFVSEKLNISCKAGLLARNFFIFIFSSLLKDNFTGNIIPGQCVLFLQHFKHFTLLFSCLQDLWREVHSTLFLLARSFLLYR